MLELPNLFAKERLDRPDAERLAAVATALGSASRVQMLGILAEQPSMTVEDLIAALDRLAQPTVSHHLRILHAAGLVSRSRDGRYIRYAVDTRGFRAMATALRPGGRR